MDEIGEQPVQGAPQPHRFASGSYIGVKRDTRKTFMLHSHSTHGSLWLRICIMATPVAPSVAGHTAPNRLATTSPSPSSDPAVGPHLPCCAITAPERAAAGELRSNHPSNSATDRTP